jgi:hypothetical protein
MTTIAAFGTTTTATIARNSAIEGSIPSQVMVCDVRFDIPSRT